MNNELRIGNLVRIMDQVRKCVNARNSKGILIELGYMWTMQWHFPWKENLSDNLTEDTFVVARRIILKPGSQALAIFRLKGFFDVAQIDLRTRYHDPD